MLLGIRHGFSNRALDFRPLTQTDADPPLFVTNDHQNAEANFVAALGFFGNPVHLDNFFFKFFWFLMEIAVICHIKKLTPQLLRHRQIFSHCRDICIPPGQKQFF